MDFKDKNKAFARLNNIVYYEADLALLRNVMPTNKLLNEAATVSKFTKPAYHSRVLLALLDKVPIDEIESNRQPTPLIEAAPNEYVVTLSSDAIAALEAGELKVKLIGTDNEKHLQVIEQDEDTTTEDEDTSDSSPADSATADSSPADSATADSSPVDSAPADSAPADSTPADSAPVDSSPADSATADSSPADSATADSSPADSATADSSPADSSPVDSAPADSTPADSAPVDSAPADSAPVDSTPADSAPADSAPTKAAATKKKGRKRNTRK